MIAPTVTTRGRVAVQRIDAVGQRTRHSVAVFAPVRGLHAVRVGPNVGSSLRQTLRPCRLLPSDASPLDSGLSSRGQGPLSTPASLGALDVRVSSQPRSAMRSRSNLGRLALDVPPAVLVRPCWHFSPTLSKKCVGLRGIMLTLIKDRISTTDDGRKRYKRLSNSRRAPIMAQSAPTWLPGTPIRGGTTRSAEKSLWAATAGARPCLAAPWLSALRWLRNTAMWFLTTGGVHADWIGMSAPSLDPKSATFAAMAARVYLAAERPPSRILLEGELVFSAAASNRHIPLARNDGTRGCALVAAASRRARRISAASLLASILALPRLAESPTAPARTRRFTCCRRVVALHRSTPTVWRTVSRLDGDGMLPAASIPDPPDAGAASSVAGRWTRFLCSTLAPTFDTAVMVILLTVVAAGRMLTDLAVDPPRAKMHLQSPGISLLSTFVLDTLTYAQLARWHRKNMIIVTDVQLNTSGETPCRLPRPCFSSEPSFLGADGGSRAQWRLHGRQADLWPAWRGRDMLCTILVLGAWPGGDITEDLRATVNVEDTMKVGMLSLKRGGAAADSAAHRPLRPSSSSRRWHRRAAARPGLRRRRRGR